MSRVHVNQRKWPDSPHWHFDAERIGEDYHGVWLFVDAATVMQRGTEQPRPAGIDMVILVPNTDPWMVEFYRDHPTDAVYVNIGSVPEWEESMVTQIDLDLDVIRKTDGTVVIVDEDEFAEHQVALAYPPAIVQLARQASDRAARLLEEGNEPFAAAADQWWPNG